MLAARPAAEILARDQDLGVAIGWLIEHEIGALPAVLVIAQVIERGLAEARALDRLQELLGHDHVGVDIDHGQGCRHPTQGGELFHHAFSPKSSRTSVRWPVTAAAAAMAGLMRWVRPPRPCRPSKLRFEVEAQRCPGSSRSAFMARHMEQPGSRHSKPASMKIWSRPSSSA